MAVVPTHLSQILKQWENMLIEPILMMFMQNLKTKPSLLCETSIKEFFLLKRGSFADKHSRDIKIMSTHA